MIFSGPFFGDNTYYGTSGYNDMYLTLQLGQVIFSNFELSFLTFWMFLIFQAALIAFIITAIIFALFLMIVSINFQLETLWKIENKAMNNLSLSCRTNAVENRVSLRIKIFEINFTLRGLILIKQSLKNNICI